MLPASHQRRCVAVVGAGALGNRAPGWERRSKPWSGSRSRRDQPLGFMPREEVNDGDNHAGDPGAL
jgi:hypothetical protein